MFLNKKFLSGILVSIFGQPVSMIATKGKIIGQAISKYWRRRDKGKTTQKG